jgi:hypothetical protein
MFNKNKKIERISTGLENCYYTYMPNLEGAGKPRETRKLERNPAFIGIWKNIFGNPRWQTKRLVNISHAPASVPSRVY